jgi:hypothetical protein
LVWGCPPPPVRRIVLGRAGGTRILRLPYRRYDWEPPSLTDMGAKNGSPTGGFGHAPVPLIAATR